MGATGAGTPYALKLELDGKVIDLVKHVATADPEVPIGAPPVAKRKRIEIEVPKGAHTLALSLVGVHDNAGCLVRVREKQTEPEPDAEATSVADAELGLAPGTYTGEFVIHDGDQDRAVGCVVITIRSVD